MNETGAASLAKRGRAFGAKPYLALRRIDRRWRLVALILLAFALRSVGLSTQSLWRDEVDSIRFALRTLGQLLQTFIAPGENGPLYFLILRPWLRLAGQSEFALRFSSVLFGVLALPLVYTLARRLFPRQPALALLAALLAALSPYLVWYSQEGKMYAAVVAFILLSMDRYLVALQRGGWHRWLSYVLITGGAMYLHLIAVLIVPVQAIVLLLYAGQVGAVRRKACLASLAVLIVPYLPLLAWQVPMLLNTGQTGYPFIPLPELVMSLLANYTLGVVQGATPWIAALFLGLLLAAGLTLAEGRAQRRPIGLLATWLLLPVAGFFLITLLRPMYTARYLIFVLPALLLLLSAGITAVGRRSRLAGGLLLAAVLALSVWGLWLQARTPLKADYRAATRHVADRLEDGDFVLFQIPYGRYSFEHYFRLTQETARSLPTVGEHRLLLPSVLGGGGEPYQSVEGLYTNNGMEPAEADRRMAGLLAGGRTVWLIASEVELWDERGLVRAWLDEHATLAGEAHFTRVDVYRYELSPTP